MTRSLVWSLYALNVLIWSSTWVAIKIGLEDVPPLLSAGVRFAIAGAGLLLLAKAMGRKLSTDAVLAGILALLPFAGAYGLIYWGEQYVPSGLAAVLFGVMPLYSATIASVALADEPLRARLVAGIGVAIVGLAIAFGESLALGDAEWALLAATACAIAPLCAAIGNVSIKRRGQQLDPIVLNGWAMLAGGALLLATSVPTEDWSQAAWTAQSLGSIAYLAVIGSAVPFVTLTILLRRAAGRDRLLHHAAAALRGARVRRRPLRRARDARRHRRGASGGERAADRAVAASPSCNPRLTADDRQE